MSLTKEQIDKFENIDFKLPNFGDIIYKENDWREDDPFKVVQVTKDKENVMLKMKNKQKSNIFNVYAFSSESGFRNFLFSWGSFYSNRKVGANSKKELELKELITNK